MIKKKEKEKKITNLELLESINRSFSKMELRMATKDDIKLEIESVKNLIEGTNNRIDDLSSNRVKYEDYKKLEVRVDFIEKRLEIKS